MKPVLAALTIFAALTASGAALAGGPIEILKDTTRSSAPGTVDVEIVPIFWDQRCADVSFVLDDIPANPGTAAEIPSSMIRRELQAAFDSWNRIPTSYINMNITAIRKLGNGLPKVDFINELTFELEPDSGVLADSQPIALNQDMTFAAGDDLDQDGDADVFDPRSARRNNCFDADNDGDIEFPAGFYKAGTILENDVAFNFGVLWNTVPAVDGFDGSVDIQAIGAHEFGHSHGLNHSAINQISALDGSAATMYPFLDFDNQATQRDLHVDEIAWSSFLYPEGTALSGPAALQQGDKSFWSEFGVIKGEVTTAGTGVLGASVKAVTAVGGAALVEAFSGTGLLLRDTVTGLTTSARAVNGNYRLPVPRGLFDISIEALDGRPVTPDDIASLTPIVGRSLGQNIFPEESRSLSRFEDDTEKRPGAASPVFVLPGFTRPGIDVVTNRELQLRNAGISDEVAGEVVGLMDVIYAERFTNAEVLARLTAGSLLTTALFETFTFDASVVPRFKRAGVFLGRLDANGTPVIDLTRPVLAQPDFIGQEFDLAPLYARLPRVQSPALEQRLRADPTLDVFVVLEADNDFVPGPSGLPAFLLGEGVTTPAQRRGRSFLSAGGGPYAPVPRNWSMELRFTVPSGNVFEGR